MAKAKKIEINNIEDQPIVDTNIEKPIEPVKEGEIIIVCPHCKKAINLNDLNLDKKIYTIEAVMSSKFDYNNGIGKYASLKSCLDKIHKENFDITKKFSNEDFCIAVANVRAQIEKQIPKKDWNKKELDKARAAAIDFVTSEIKKKFKSN
jgi:hypothetical protein